jgi:hypothetical protein
MIGGSLEINFKPYSPNMKNSISLHLLFIFLLGHLAQAEVIDLGSRRELFIDDFLIEKLSGSADQKLHLPEPREVVLTTDAPWEGNTCAYYTVFRDGDIFRMYYRGSHFDEKSKKSSPQVACYAESKDGIHWTKPELGLFESHGTKKNNIVWNGIGTESFVAFKDTNPNCPPEAQYKGMGGVHPKAKRGLYVFSSPDGIHWSQIKQEPVIIKGYFDSQNLAFWDTHSNQYREYHRTFTKGVRAIMTGTSTDYINWSEPELLQYQENIPNQQLYTNAILPYERAPHLLLGFPTSYLPKEGQRVEPTLMISRDGLNFHRWLPPIIPETAPKDRSGNRSNYMAWGLVEIPGRPNHLSCYASEAYYTGPDSRLRRFEYRKDGFVSIHADNTGGELLTKSFRFKGTQLELNYATRKDGYLTVELTDESGNALEGFSIIECSKLTGDQIAQPVSWNSGANLGNLSGKTIRMKVSLKNADLYSFRFQTK